MRTTYSLTILYVLCLTMIHVLPAAESTKSHSFEVCLLGDLAMTIDGENVKINSESRFQYTNKYMDGRLQLYSDSMTVSAKQNGKLAMEMSFDKNGAKGEGGKVIFTAANATEAQKKILHAQFELPLASVDLDDNGKEIKRSVTTEDGAAMAIQSGAVQNMRLFHFPFFKDKDEWKANSEVSMGKGGIATGDLTIKKTATSGDLQIVSVTGTLSNAKALQANNMSTRNTVYEIIGEQSYDPAIKEWVSGKWTANIKFDLYAGEKQIGGATGTLKTEFTKK